MMLDLTTPALLFPAISLLLLAYTNRFLAVASVIRGLHERHLTRPDPAKRQQIAKLRQRVRLIQWMQGLGITSLLGCVLCMGLLFADLEHFARATFAVSLVLMMASLALSVLEIRISANALDIELEDLAGPSTPTPPS